MTTLENRFWAKVDKNGPTQPHMDTPCWVWTGSRSKGKWPYGRIKDAGHVRFAHCVAWMFSHGEIPAGLLVMHRCDNPSCVRVDHLSVGTQAQNMADMWGKGRGDSGDRNAMRRPEVRARCSAAMRASGCQRGARNASAKLTEEQALAIRSAVGKQRSIAAEYGVSQRTVWAIKSGLLWGHLP